MTRDEREYIVMGMFALAIVLIFVVLLATGCTTPTSPTCIRADAPNAKTSGLPECKP